MENAVPFSKRSDGGFDRQGVSSFLGDALISPVRPEFVEGQEAPPERLRIKGGTMQNFGVGVECAKWLRPAFWAWPYPKKIRAPPHIFAVGLLWAESVGNTRHISCPAHQNPSVACMRQ